MIFDFQTIFKIVIGAIVGVLTAVLLIFLYHWIGNQFKSPQVVQQEPGQYHFTINGPTAQPPSPQVIYVPVETEQKITTEIKTEQKKKGDPTDMEYRLKTNYFVTINDKTYELAPAVKEDTKLQNNKIVMTQDSTLRIKVDVPRPVGSFGAGMNNHGELALMADGKMWKNVSWWAYGSKTEQAGGLKVTIYK